MSQVGVKTAAPPKKYEGINFKPPADVAAEAEKGLEYRSRSGKGGLSSQEAGKAGIGSGVQRAVNLKNRDNITPETISKMLGFFSRSEKNKTISPENKNTPWEDAGYVAWLLWGGDKGRAWAEKVKAQMDKADEKSKQASPLSLQRDYGSSDGEHERVAQEILRRIKQKTVTTEELSEYATITKRKYYAAPQPVEMWHETDLDSANAILQQGFIPGELSGKGETSVLVYGHPKEALGKRDRASYARGPGPGVTLRIDLKGLKLLNLYSIPYVLDVPSYEQPRAKLWMASQKSGSLPGGFDGFYIPGREVAVPANVANSRKDDVIYSNRGKPRKASLADSWGPTLGGTDRPNIRKAKTYNRIVMYDFDGTLFRSWERTPEWWPDKTPYSFFMQPESLDAPCVPETPGGEYWISRAVAAALEDTKDRNTFSVLITGRVGVHAKRVEELLSQKGIKFDLQIYNPGMSASKFKTLTLGKLLAGHNTVSEVSIWENENQSHYAQYLDTASRVLGRGIRVVVNNVHEDPIPLSCGPQDFGLATEKTAGETSWKEVGVFIPLPEELSGQFPTLSEDSSKPHVTFLYIGEVPKGQGELLKKTVREFFLQERGPIMARLSGVDYFTGQTERVAYSKVHFSTDMGAMRDRLASKLQDAGFAIENKFPLAYAPHVTLSYMQNPHDRWNGNAPRGEWHFHEVELWGLTEAFSIPLGPESSPSTTLLRIQRKREASRKLFNEYFGVRQ